MRGCVWLETKYKRERKPHRLIAIDSTEAVYSIYIKLRNFAKFKPTLYHSQYLSDIPILEFQTPFILLASATPVFHFVRVI